MAEAKRTTKKKNTESRVRRERRFVPEATGTTKAGLVALLLGGALLGAGLYGQWIREEPLEYAPYLLSAGALAMAVGLWFGDARTGPVRVGDAGVAVEHGDEVRRVVWCDVERVTLERGTLLVKSKETTLSLPVSAHRLAIAWILAEGGRRVPDVFQAKRADLADLPETRESDGEQVTVEALQVTGRACAESGKPIAFERDARLCPTCAQVYHREHVPKTCVTCGEALNKRALPV